MAAAHADAVAEAVLNAFRALPPKYKPRSRSEATREWVPLSGIVLASSAHPPTCVSLATGMKCLPRDKLKFADGVTLHDCHAEVLALRAFNRFLLEQCHRVAAGGDSEWIEAVETNRTKPSEPFRLRDDIRIYMYSSEAPCGDASMELIMAEQDDATPWNVPDQGNSLCSDAGYAPLHGRGYFSQLGVVRTKPSRPDAPPTWSKSCTDKLALRQCTSVLSSVTSLLIAPGNAYIDTLVLPSSQLVRVAAERAFGPAGRFARLANDSDCAWPGDSRYRPFKIESTALEFEHSKRSGPSHGVRIASNISAIWTPGSQEVLINGALQGRKQFDPRGASALSRKSMWKLAVELVGSSGLADCQIPGLGSQTYEGMKACVALEARARVKEDVRRAVLQSWVCNSGDEAFTLQSP